MSETTIASPTAAPTAAERSHRRRVLASSFLGSLIEYYDFLLYGVAASLVFGPLFFADLEPGIAIIASFGTLAIGYLSRPLGGIIFGHLGDRFGRKSVLVATMVLMGVASTLIGLLPTHAQIGPAAAFLLVALRLVQGLAVGGEWGGAVLMTLEHADSKRRGLAASVTHAGGPSGALLATLVMTAFSTLPTEQFLSWGWRVPFLISALLLVVGLFVRFAVRESPLFQAERERAAAQAVKQPVPIVQVLRRHLGSVLLLAFGSSAAFAFQSLLATFAITFAVTTGADRSQVLLAHAATTFIHIFTIPLFASISDRVGRRPVIITGALLGAVLAWPILSLLGSGSIWLVALGFLLGNPLVQALQYGPLAALMGEAFGTSARYTGASLGYQLGSTLGAGLTPVLAASLLALGGGVDPTFVVLLLVAVSLVSAVAVLLIRESYRKDLDPGATAIAPAVPSSATAA